MGKDAKKATKPAKMWRHGDVMLAEAAAVPPGAKLQRTTVLAYGEVTGHSHRIADPATAEVWELNGTHYLNVTDALATLIHEEHKPIPLPQGVYRVWIQREYTPAEIRRVID
jgi:hypothetical protein